MEQTNAVAIKRKRRKNNGHMRNEGIGYEIFKIFNYAFMIFIILITLVPYLNVFAKAFNDANDSMRGGITIYPRVFTTENFKILLKDPAMYQAAMVTIGRTVYSVIVNLTVQFFASYALSRKHAPGMKYFNFFFIFPGWVSSGLIANYILMSKIGLLNTFWVYVLPGTFSFYNSMIIRSYINSNIPEEVIESAHLDGASEVRIVFQMIMPLSLPILATISLWTAVGEWNDWRTTLYYVQTPSLHVLQYKLMQTIKESERIISLIQSAMEEGQDVEELQNQVQVTPESLQAAQVVVVTLPIICLYPFLQKYFVKGVTLGSVKG